MPKKVISLILLFFLSRFVFAAEGDVYNFSWLDKDKEVFVLQNRKYRKVNRVHASIGGGLTTSGAFVSSKTYQARFGYFFHENWGVEGIYAMNSGEENSTASSLRNEGSAGSRPFRRIVDNYYGAMLMWSPFYAKINTFNTIIYVDWFFGAGYGQLKETNNTQEFLTGLDSASTTTETHGGILWDTGLKFWLSKNFDLRLDMTVFHYQANRPNAQTSVSESSWYSNWDLALGLGYNF